MQTDNPQCENSDNLKRDLSKQISIDNANRAIYEKDNYQKPFECCLNLLDSYQSKKDASSIFQWLDHVSGYDFDDSAKDEILRMDYLTIWKFEDELNKLDEALQTKFHRVSKRDARTIAATLLEELGRIAPTLESEAVKKRIHAEYANFEPYEIIDSDGFIGMVAVPGVWPGFNLEKHLHGYIFEEYLDWLSKRFKAIISVVEKFESGYPESVSVREEKSERQYPELKHGIIYEKRWNEFIRLCFALAQRVTFKNGVDAQFIKYNEVDNSFHWIGDPAITNKFGPIPSLAQYILMLQGNAYFDFPIQRGSRTDICRNYLEFFHLPVTEDNWKLLCKELRNSESKYAGLFAPGTWHAA